ncbi:hypothetical protein [uncultured Celeribacter sp.]|uniref:hypothetical protein n=1 Tax=uncultured Celeribacter sp. TaxID=1303376 RepID=UPI002AA7BA26|nr:hypothetical protein [uncultured Celeribacter sp.]
MALNKIVSCSAAFSPSKQVETLGSYTLWDATEGKESAGLFYITSKQSGCILGVEHTPNPTFAPTPRLFRVTEIIVPDNYFEIGEDRFSRFAISSTLERSLTSRFLESCEQEAQRSECTKQAKSWIAQETATLAFRVGGDEYNIDLVSNKAYFQGEILDD